MSGDSGLDVLVLLFVRAFETSPKDDNSTDTPSSTIKDVFEDEDVELEKMQDHLHSLFTLLCRCNHEYVTP